MEGENNSTTFEPTSLDVILEQMEASDGPDFHSLADLVTAGAEDFQLGGEVEIRAGVEVRSSQNQAMDTSENVAAGPTSNDAHLVFQGGAQDEENRLEEAIGMEVEVARKSSSSSDPGSPAEVHFQGRYSPKSGNSNRRRNEVVHNTEENFAGLVKGREMYIPPVTEWRDLLDSQDMLQEYARNMVEAGGGEEEEESERRGEEEEEAREEAEEESERRGEEGGEGREEAEEESEGRGEEEGEGMEERRGEEGGEGRGEVEEESERRGEEEEEGREEAEEESERRGEEGGEGREEAEEESEGRGEEGGEGRGEEKGEGRGEAEEEGGRSGGEGEGGGRGEEDEGVGEEGGEGGRERDEERMNGEEEELVMEEQEVGGEGEDESVYEEESDEIVDVVEMDNKERGYEDQQSHPAQMDMEDGGSTSSAQVNIEDSGSTSKKAGKPDHLEMFLPSNTPLYRQASLTNRAATNGSASRDLEVARHFLEQERELLQTARWMPALVEESRQPMALANDRPLVVPPTRVSRTEGSHSRGVVLREDVQTTPSISSSSVHLTAQSHASTCSSSSLQRDISHKKTGETSATTRPHEERAPITTSTNAKRLVKDTSMPLDARKPVLVVQPPIALSHTSAHPEEPVATASRDEDTHSDSSFFYHDSQVEEGGGEERERAITLCSPSASSEYESAVEVHRPDKPAVNEKDRPTGGMQNALQTSQAPISCVGSSTGSTVMTQSNTELSSHALVNPSNLREASSEGAACQLSPLQHTNCETTVDGHTRGTGEERPVKGRAGKKGKRPHPKDCRIKIQKFSLNRDRGEINRDSLSSEESETADLPGNVNICLDTQQTDVSAAIHDFMTRLTLPPVCISPTKEKERRKRIQRTDGLPAFLDLATGLPLPSSVCVSPTEEKERRTRTPEKESVKSRSPVPEDALSPSFFEVPTASDICSLSTLQAPVEDLPVALVRPMNGRTTVTETMQRAIKTEPEADSLPVKTNALRLRRRRHLQHGDITGNATIATPQHSQPPFQLRSHTQSRNEKPKSPVIHSQEEERECPIQIKKIIHAFWFRHSIALTGQSENHLSTNPDHPPSL